MLSDDDLRVTISLDRRTRSIAVTDNGIGMTREELVENLGTIARSGTAAFADALSAEESTEGGLIGQFGVGFYSVFMVGDRVDVLSRRAGEEEGWRWTSDGQGEFTIAEDDSAPERGTVVSVHLREEDREFRDPERVRTIVREYSDHIALPIMLETDDEPEQLNSASALWTRPQREIDDSQYAEFYRHVARAFDEPWLTAHFKTEGRLSYTGLLFVPSSRPFDLMHADARGGVRLYVRRVFITDEYEELVPRYLRFLRGVVDSEDIPLNISRDTLQHSPVLDRIRRGLTRQVLRALRGKADEAPDEYDVFWENFGAVLKEGIYQDEERKDDLLALARFHSTRDEGGLVSLADYVERMPKGQESIYYLSADELRVARGSPHVESFAARGVEVLLLTDEVDEIWVQALGSYKDHPLQSVTRGALDLSDIAPPDGEPPEPDVDSPAVEALVDLLKSQLGDAVKDVRASGRLTDSAVVLVADEIDLDIRLARMLSDHGGLDALPPRILEVNAGHTLIKRLAELAASGETDILDDIGFLLLDQARIAEGEPATDPAAFTRRMAAVLERSLKG